MALRVIFLYALLCEIQSWSSINCCYLKVNVKVVKCILVQALRLYTGHTAHRGSRGIALPFHDHGTRRGWGVRVTPWLLFTPGKHLVPIVQEAGWTPGPVWTGAENLAPTGIRSPDCPAHSQSLYWVTWRTRDLNWMGEGGGGGRGGGNERFIPKWEMQNGGMYQCLSVQYEFFHLNISEWRDIPVFSYCPNLWKKNVKL